MGYDAYLGGSLEVCMSLVWLRDSYDIPAREAISV